MAEHLAVGAIAEFTGFDELVELTQQRLVDQVKREVQTRQDRNVATSSMDEQAIAGKLLDGALTEVIKDWSNSGGAFPTPEEEALVKETVLAEMFGLGRLQPLLDDRMVENIDIVGCERAVLTYADGRVMRGHRIASTDEALIRFLQRLAARHGRTERTFNNAQPLLTMEIQPGGERLAATMNVTDRPHVSIRRNRFPEVHLERLYELGMLSRAQLALLRSAIQARKNIMICGEQSAGKTTLLRALCWEIPETERFATLETDHELGLHRYRDRFPQVVAYEERPGNTERENGRPIGGISLSTMVQHALRMHTGRLIVGEVRGPEVFPMLEALSTGGNGSLSTIHSRSASDAIERLVGLCLHPARQWTVEFAYRMIAQSIDLIVHVALDKSAGGRDRYVDEIVSIERGESGRPAETAVFRTPRYGDRTLPGRRAVPTGHPPADLADYEQVGFSRDWLTGVGDGEWQLDGPRTRSGAAYV